MIGADLTHTFDQTAGMCSSTPGRSGVLPASPDQVILGSLLIEERCVEGLRRYDRPMSTGQQHDGDPLHGAASADVQSAASADVQSAASADVQSAASAGMHSQSHSHSHSHDVRGAQKNALLFAVGANTLLLGAQVAVGLILGSLALLADSLHNASDVVALIVALIGQGLAARPATPRQSYGLARAEILGALLNGAVLLALTGWVVVTAVGRFSNPTTLDPLPLAAIGLLGLVVNAGSAWYLSRSGGKNLNIRAAFWHLVADALGSFGVMLAAAAIYFFDALWADPAASILISMLILVGVWRLMKDTVMVLLEVTPKGIEPTEVTVALESMAGIRSIHHLHIWGIDSEATALTAHLELEDGADLHQAQELADAARLMLHDRFSIAHATFEPECHDCGAPEHD